MIYFFYDIFLFLAALIYLPFYALRGRLHADILTRLGFFNLGDFGKLQEGDAVWIHAVSVGEARASESLVRFVRKEWPEKRIVLSTVTPTGHAIVCKILKEDEAAFYAPLDISFVVKKFLKVLHPSLLIIMETEIWPNLIRLSKKSGCVVAVVNGRLSDRTLRGYKKMAWFMKPVLKSVDLFCMQTEEAAARIRSLGVLPEKIKTTGNIKFDMAPDSKESPSAARLKSALQDSFLIIAGSTHEDEEEQIVSIYQSLRKDFSSLRLLIAPRHLERLDKIRRMIRLHGLEAVNLSHLVSFSSAQVALLDTMGDLGALYRLCGVAFVGGSLVDKGGHNPIEPALFGRPVIFGKHMENFKEIRDIFINEKAAIEVNDSLSLEYELRKLLADPNERKLLGDRAQLLLNKNRGAAQQTFSVLKDLVR
jgi:3-deoxy-D-manno-octulosonic-acid transferase